MKEKKDRFDDALHATRAAVEEGFLFTASLSKCHWHFFFPGGGTALIRAAQKLEGVKPENDDEKLGIEIIRRAVEEPLRMIVECCGCRTSRGNAGLEGSVVVNEVKNGGNRGGSAANGYSDYGYNARAEKYENLFQSGVIDPAKERESSELSPRGPGERRQHRRHAPHYFYARRASPLASNATGIFASATSRSPCYGVGSADNPQPPPILAWVAWAACIDECVNARLR